MALAKLLSRWGLAVSDVACTPASKPKTPMREQVGSRQHVHLDA